MNIQIKDVSRCLSNWYCDYSKLLIISWNVTLKTLTHTYTHTLTHAHTHIANHFNDQVVRHTTIICCFTWKTIYIVTQSDSITKQRHNKSTEMCHFYVTNSIATQLACEFTQIQQQKQSQVEEDTFGIEFIWRALRWITTMKIASKCGETERTKKYIYTNNGKEHMKKQGMPFFRCAFIEIQLEQNVFKMSMWFKRKICFIIFSVGLNKSWIKKKLQQSLLILAGVDHWLHTEIFASKRNPVFSLIFFFY